jgi:hypothetical protein
VSNGRFESVHTSIVRSKFTHRSQMNGKGSRQGSRPIETRRSPSLSLTLFFFLSFFLSLSSLPRVGVVEVLANDAHDSDERHGEDHARDAPQHGPEG